MEITHELGLYLAEKRHVPFAWGTHDCNTLVVEWHDSVHGTDYLSQLHGKYTTRFGALKFVRNTLNAETWFKQAGYQRVNTPKSGDILSDGFAAWIVFGFYAYTIHENGTLTRQPLDGMAETAWRHERWVQ